MREKSNIRVIYRPQCPWATEWLKIVKQRFGQHICEYNLWNLQDDPWKLLGLDENELDKALAQFLFSVFVNEKLICIGPQLTPSNADRVLKAQRNKQREYAVLTKPLSDNNIDDEIELCLSCHPSGALVSDEGLLMGKEIKRKWFKEVLTYVDPCGILAYKNSRLVGLIEYLPSTLANKLGFTLTKDEETLTITCMEVAIGQKRQPLYRVLVSALIDNLARNNQGYRKVEVIAEEGNCTLDYPEGYPIMHPFYLYRELGFRKRKMVGLLNVMDFDLF